MSVDPIIIANEFLKLAQDYRDQNANTTRFVNALELHKLVVIAHGYNYAFHDEILVKDKLSYSKFEPTFERLAKVLEYYGDEPVTGYLPLNGSGEQAYFDDSHPYEKPILTKQQVSVIQDVWEPFLEHRLKCHHLAFVTRGTHSNWTDELCDVTLSGVYSLCDYPIERLAARVRSINSNKDDERSAA